jgi:hypothetical protein
MRAWCNGCIRAFQALRSRFEPERPLHAGDDMMIFDEASPISRELWDKFVALSREQDGHIASVMAITTPRKESDPVSE